MALLTAISASIDFTGIELVIRFELTAGSLPVHLSIPRSIGVPYLSTSLGVVVPVIPAMCAWEIKRSSPESLYLWARYKIKDSARVTKPQTGYTVSGSTGLISDDDSNSTVAFSDLSVTNGSEVDGDGWFDRAVYLPAPPRARTIHVDPVLGNNNNSGLSPSLAKQTLDGTNGGLAAFNARSQRGAG